MSNEGVSIPAPLFVTWYQCVITVLICWLAGKIGERYQQLPSYSKVATSDNGGTNGEQTPNQPAQKPSFFSQFPKAEYDWDVARKVFPLSVIFVGMITFNNLCLKLVEVSFYNVARSLTIVFNVFFTWCMLGMGSTFTTVSCLGIVILGFLMGITGEINFSVIGTFAGVMSSLFVSLNSIFTKKVRYITSQGFWVFEGTFIHIY
jgi:GDP-fucose transporter C1